MQPEPQNLMGRTPVFETFQGEQFQRLREAQGAWEIRSPFFDQNCNHVDNLDWTWRFIVGFCFFSLN